VDLDSIGYVGYDPVVLDRHTNGVPFNVTLPSCGRKVEFFLATGKTDQKGMPALRRGESGEIIARQLLPRIGKIEGVHQNDRIRFLSDLDLEDLNDLHAAFDAVDGGPDIVVPAVCTATLCGATRDVMLPLLAEPAFYLPEVGHRRNATQRAASIARYTGR
jgi:hypothetical protein